MIKWIMLPSPYVSYLSNPHNNNVIPSINGTKDMSHWSRTWDEIEVNIAKWNSSNILHPKHSHTHVDFSRNKNNIVKDSVG